MSYFYIVTLYGSHQVGFPTSKTTFYGEVLRMNRVQQSEEEKLLCSLAADTVALLDSSRTTGY